MNEDELWHVLCGLEQTLFKLGFMVGFVDDWDINDMRVDWDINDMRVYLDKYGTDR